jgi:hydrogenase-4 component B
MPSPGDPRAAHLTVEMSDLVWDWLYAPIANVVADVGDKLNRFQFLTIRKYLSLVFVVLVALLLGLSLWF